jgi:hypothetical protein
LCSFHISHEISVVMENTMYVGFWDKCGYTQLYIYKHKSF